MLQRNVTAATSHSEEHAGQQWNSTVCRSISGKTSVAACSGGEEASMTVRFGGLLADTLYVFQLFVENAVGRSNGSSISDPLLTPPASLPAAPPRPKVRPLSASSASVCLGLPPSTGGTPISSFVLELVAPAAPLFNQVVQLNFSSLFPSTTIEGRSNGAKISGSSSSVSVGVETCRRGEREVFLWGIVSRPVYIVRLRVVSEIGISQASNDSLPLILQGATVPSAPFGLQEEPSPLEPLSEGEVALTWCVTCLLS